MFPGHQHQAVTRSPCSPTAPGQHCSRALQIPAVQLACIRQRKWERRRGLHAHASAGRGRHVEVADPGQWNEQGAPREDIEADVRYARVDMSDVHQHQARCEFARCIASGEASMRLAEAALWVCAEDDAVASHSTVAFPVASYLARIQRITQDVQQRLRTLGLLPPDHPSSSPSQQQQPDPHAVLKAVEASLFAGAEQTQPELISLGFRMPPKGRSGLPPNAVVDHTGTWEDARDAYMHEVLIRRRGHPAALAILYAEVMSQLYASGAVDFVAAMNLGDHNVLPRGVVLPGLTRQTMQQGSASAPLNTCSSDTLAELLCHLKRAYWPWAWNTQGDHYSHGGFRAAAKAGVGDEMSAVIRAVSTVAAWRLDRGIWTSPGAGDLRRARAAAERLVMLRGDAQPDERRDLAVALLHCGELGAARAELRAYMDTQHFRAAADPFDKVLCYKLRDVLASAGDSVQEPQEVTNISQALNKPPPQGMAKKPLTW